MATETVSPKPILSMMVEKFTPPKVLDMGEPKWLDVDGIRTRYFDKGEGERIVFFHGGNLGDAGGTSTARVWDLNFVPLSRFFNVISVERLGQAFTDIPKTDDGYTMHASVQHAAAFLRTLGKGPYHVVGHSRGGYVVCRLSMEYPELVKSCTIVSSGSLSPGQPRTHLVMANAPVPKISRQAVRWHFERYSYNIKIVTEEWMDELMSAAGLEKNQIAIQKMNKEGLLQKLFLPGLVKQRTETHRWLLERGMPCPTLVTWGYNDPTADLENGKLLIEVLMKKQRNTEVRLFNRSGHFVYREHPEAFSRMIYKFVKQYS